MKIEKTNDLTEDILRYKAAQNMLVKPSNSAISSEKNRIEAKDSSRAL